MKISITAPKGRTPRLADNLLTANDATIAENCYSGRGDLRAWYKPLLKQELTLTSVQTIYHYTNTNDGDVFLSDGDDLDHVLSPIAEDPYERCYYTGESEPRVHCNDIELTETLSPDLCFDGDNEAAVMRFEEIALDDCTAAVSAVQAHAGAQSCAVTRTAVGNGDFAYTLEDADLSKIRADYEVTIEGYIYLPAGLTLASVKVQSSDDGATWTDEATITATAAWTAFSFSFTPDTYFGLRFLGVAGDQTDVFYVDDVTIKQVLLDYYKLGIPQPDTTTPDTNISVAGGGTAEDRIYAYTFVTKYGEESAPSIISALVAGATDTDTIEVFKIEAVPLDRQITTLRLYRTATGSTDQAEFYKAKDFTLPAIAGKWSSGNSIGYNGEYWEFDDGTDNIIYECINNGTTADPDDATHGVAGGGAHHWDYYIVTDDVTTATMLTNGVVCPSSTYLPPPEGLTGLRRLPGGTLVGFVGNALYVSEPFLPHAWPDMDLTFDSDIVAIEVSMSMIVVATHFKAHLVNGDSPDTMYSIPLPGVFPCLSKRSMCAGLDGVYYASNEGFVRVTDAGAVNATIEFMDASDWKAIGAAYLHSNIYSNKLFAFNPSSGESFVIDFDTRSYASLSDTYYASHVSSIDGKFYIVTKTGSTYYIKEWEGDQTNLMQYTWESKEFRHSLNNWGAARVRLDNDFYSEYLEYLEDNNTLVALNAAMIAGMTMGGALCDDELCSIPICGTGLYSIADMAISSAVVFQLWVDGTKRYERTLSTDKPFKMPGRYKGRRTKIRLYGYIPVSPMIEVATSMEELLNAAA